MDAMALTIDVTPAALQVHVMSAVLEEYVTAMFVGAVRSAM
jgi:hypothetical protein